MAAIPRGRPRASPPSRRRRRRRGRRRVNAAASARYSGTPAPSAVAARAAAVAARKTRSAWSRSRCTDERGLPRRRRGGAGGGRARRVRRRVRGGAHELLGVVLAPRLFVAQDGVGLETAGRLASRWGPGCGPGGRVPRFVGSSYGFRRSWRRRELVERRSGLRRRGWQQQTAAFSSARELCALRCHAAGCVTSECLAEIGFVGAPLGVLKL